MCLGAGDLLPLIFHPIWAKTEHMWLWKCKTSAFYKGYLGHWEIIASFFHLWGSTCSKFCGKLQLEAMWCCLGGCKLCRRAGDACSSLLFCQLHLPGFLLHWSTHSLKKDLGEGCLSPVGVWASQAVPAVSFSQIIDLRNIHAYIDFSNFFFRCIVSVAWTEHLERTHLL